MKTNVSSLHAIGDYLIGALLLVGPWLFVFADDIRSALATQAFGIAIIGYCLFTDHEPSDRTQDLDPYTHENRYDLRRVVDRSAVDLEILSPITWIPHLVIGIVIAARAFLYAVASGTFCRRDRSTTERQSLPTPVQ